LVVFYYGTKLFVRHLLPRLIKRYVNKRMNQFYGENAQKNSSYQSQKRKDKKGGVTIHYSPGTKKYVPNDEGEYIDYKEKKDKA